MADQTSTARAPPVVEMSKPRISKARVIVPHAIPSRVIVALSGASGAIYGIKALQLLRELGGAPCSARTLGAIASSLGENLMVRAADVCLKERRPLVLLFRETPLHLGHIELMADVTRYGAIVMPPVPAFYTRPETADDIATQTAARALDVLGIPVPSLKRWPEAYTDSPPAPIAGEE